MFNVYTLIAQSYRQVRHYITALINFVYNNYNALLCYLFLSCRQIEKTKWDRDPVKNSCEAYMNARKELGIMLTLKHPHIVPLLAISIRPLSLVLSLAPQGALRDRLLDFERAGTRVPAYVIRNIIIQVS